MYFCRIKIKDLSAYRISVFFRAFRQVCQCLEIFEIIRCQFCCLTLMKQKSRLFHSQFKKVFNCRIFIYKFCKIIRNRGNITPLFIILKQNPTKNMKQKISLILFFPNREQQVQIITFNNSQKLLQKKRF